MSSHKNFERMGPLDCLVHQGASDSDMTVVLFHGFGADAADLFPLARALDIPQVGRWIFPEGILSAEGAGFGRAWFPIDMLAYEEAMRTGNFRDFSQIPEGLEKARKTAESFISQSHLDPAKTIIGGFSQGAMLATHTLLNSNASFAGLALLSGTFLGSDEWPKLASSRPTPLFQSHGKQDPILPFKEANRLFEMLQNSKWRGEFHGFAGGHEIPTAVLLALKGFIERLV